MSWSVNKMLFPSGRGLQGWTRRCAVASEQNAASTGGPVACSAELAKKMLKLALRHVRQGTRSLAKINYLSLD